MGLRTYCFIHGYDPMRKNSTMHNTISEKSHSHEAQKNSFSDSKMVTGVKVESGLMFGTEESWQDPLNFGRVEQLNALRII